MTIESAPAVTASPLRKGAPVVELDRHPQILRPARGAAGRLVHRLRGRGRRADRLVRLGQVDPAALHQHARGARTGHRSRVAGEEIRLTAPRPAPPHRRREPDPPHPLRARHGVPVVQPLEPHDGARQRHGGAAEGAEARPRRGRGRSDRDAAQGRHRARRPRAIPPSSRAASSSAPRSPARSASTPRSCCSTSRPRRSIPSSQGEVLRVIKLLADEGRTMLLVTHDMDFAKTIADRVVFLHEGADRGGRHRRRGVRRDEIARASSSSSPPPATA